VVMNDCVSAVDRVAFAVRTDQTLLALDAKSGDLLWQKPRGDGVTAEWGRRAAMQAGSLAFVQDPAGQIHILKAADGHPIRGTTPFQGRLVASEGRTVVVHTGRTLQFYRVR
jgi:outer membrane protein assembly factor BamB